MRRFVPLLLLLVTTALTGLAATTRDLGDGLRYVRIRDLDKETSELPAPSGPCIVDVRGATANQPESIARLKGMLDASGRGQLWLVLFDTDTAPNVLAAVETHGKSVLTLSSATTTGLKPDVLVATSPEADRKALELIDSGKPLTDVLVSKLDKRRYDEAAMVRDHTNGVPIPETPAEAAEALGLKPLSSLPTPSADPKDAPKTPIAPFDAVLQRAIHVFQALRALKKV